MASHKFYRVYMKELEKKKKKIEDLYKNWSNDNEIIRKIAKKKSKILKEIVEILIEAKADLSGKKINAFEFNYLRYNLLFIFATKSTTHLDAPLFWESMDRLQKEKVISLEERESILEMSPIMG